ncbi:MAG: type I 3-dehydroquinate dehydratase [Deltaproteobacteria bacterium]|nr:type I 3-dehydroquinate dehydratase [Deltaproteobacteria bacterium]
MKKGTDKRRTPLTAGVIAGSIKPQDVKKAIASGADILEIRVDTYRRRNPDDIARAMRGAGRPTILTIRSKKEGGRFHIPDDKRLELFNALAPFAKYVDIELSSSAILKNVVDLSRRLGKKLIISYHNFKKTPGGKELTGIVKKGISLRADIVKIACAAKDAGDFRRLASLLIAYDCLSVIGMGRGGKASRVLFPALGSKIAYGSITTAAAPGQMSVREIKKEFKRFYITG